MTGTVTGPAVPGGALEPVPGAPRPCSAPSRTSSTSPSGPTSSSSTRASPRPPATTSDWPPSAASCCGSNPATPSCCSRAAPSASSRPARTPRSSSAPSTTPSAGGRPRSASGSAPPPATRSGAASPPPPGSTSAGRASCRGRTRSSGWRSPDTGAPPASTWVLTAGLGGMGSAQPIAARMAGTSSLTVEVDPAALERSSRSGGVEVVLDDAGSALAAVDAAARDGRPLAVGLLGNAATVYPLLLDRLQQPVRPGDQSDQSGHRHRHDRRPRPARRVPAARRSPSTSGRSSASATPRRWRERPARPSRSRCGPCRSSGGAAPSSSRTATTCASTPSSSASADAFTVDGFVPRYLRPLFARGIGPFRWIALSGDPADLDVLDEHRRRDQRPSRGRGVDRARPPARRSAGPAGAQLLAGPRRAVGDGAARPTPPSATAACRPRSCSPATTWTPPA